MASKTISITEEVYEMLVKLKSPEESFSELFQGLIQTHKENIKTLFGKWQLTEEEKQEMIDKVSNRTTRKWHKPEI